MAFFLLGFAVILILVGGVYVIAQFLSLFTAAPFVPSSAKRVAAMIAFAEIKPGEHVVDLGSGDGRLVLAAARAGAEAEGWEANALLVWWSRMILRLSGAAAHATVHLGSYRGIDLRHADVVFLYVLPAEMARLERWFPAALHPGARVVVNAFPFPTWTPEEKRGTVYRYRVPTLFPPAPSL